MIEGHNTSASYFGDMYCDYDEDIAKGCGANLRSRDSEMIYLE